MNILAFDTCLDACSAAVLQDAAGGAISCAFEPMATGQAERLVPMIAELMNEAGLTFPEIDRIAVTTGPGTFTGTRIAIAAARALALASKIEIVTASSLSVIAQQVVRHRDAPEADAIAVAVDARRGHVYWQRFARSSGLDALCEPQLLTPEQAARQCAGRAYIIAGSGAEAVASHDPGKLSALSEIILPRAEDLATMALRMQAAASSPKPLYLRAADAKPQTGKSIERVPT